MGEYSTIEWTHHTFNPWWGCTKVSAGCTHCYAETWANRYGHDVWGPKQNRRTFSEQHWKSPIKWNRKAELSGNRLRVFCASMADVFEDNLQVVEERQRLWNVIQETPMLDWLLLTKRPENMQRFASYDWVERWPNNVWAMTSVENQDVADTRIPLLLNVPAKVRALSVEPLLGLVNLKPWLEHLDWVIVGGESGRQARAINPEWVRTIRNQCLEEGVAFFFKQWGEYGPVSMADGTTCMKKLGKKKSGRLLDGREWNELPHTENLASLAVNAVL